MCVVDAARQPAAVYLDNDPKLPDVVRALGTKPDLDVTRLGWTAPGFLCTVHGLRYEVRKQLSEATEVVLGRSRVVGDIHEWHHLTLPVFSSTSSDQRRAAGEMGQRADGQSDGDARS